MNSLAIDLAHSAGLTSEDYIARSEDEVTREEKRRCFWSIFLFKRLHGASFSSLDFSVETHFPWYPKSSEQPPLSNAYVRETGNLLRDIAFHQSIDLGIVANMIELSDMWFKTTRYVRRRGKPSLIPPWSPESEYSTILSQQKDFVTRMPHIHRFRVADFNRRTSQDLESNRSYWGPWLFIQFVFHTNICLLAHPLLMSLRLRNFRDVIPGSFLQETFNLIGSHAVWIVPFIDMLESKSYRVSDPFLGNCAAIIATIHLQYAFTTIAPAQRDKQSGEFAKCLKFICLIGEHWPHMARLVC